MTSIALPLVLSYAWLCTPFLSGALVAGSSSARAFIARHLVVCLVAGWSGVALLMWGATALGQVPGLVAFLVGGPLAGLSIWSRGGHNGGPDHEPPDEPSPIPPEWDWERFERELHALDDARRVCAR